MINQKLREQIREFQTDFAEDMTKDMDSMTEQEKKDIPPLSIEDLAPIMQVEPTILESVFQHPDFVPPFTQLDQVLGVGIDIVLFFEEIESSQNFTSAFNIISPDKKPMLTAEDEKDKPVFQEKNFSSKTKSYLVKSSD